MQNILSASDLKHLAAVIAEVEQKTVGELRLMIVGRSTRGSYVFPLLGFMLSTLQLLALWPLRYQLILSGRATWILILALAAAWVFA